MRAWDLSRRLQGTSRPAAGTVVERGAVLVPGRPAVTRTAEPSTWAGVGTADPGSDALAAPYATAERSRSAGGAPARLARRWPARLQSPAPTVLRTVIAGGGADQRPPSAVDSPAPSPPSVSSTSATPRSCSRRT